jgi:hypothetical protein
MATITNSTIRTIAIAEYGEQVGAALADLIAADERVWVAENGGTDPPSWLGEAPSMTVAAAHSRLAERIEALDVEADAAGDRDVAAMCDRALGGDEDAIVDCIRAIIAGQG